MGMSKLFRRMQHCVLSTFSFQQPSFFFQLKDRISFNAVSPGVVSQHLDLVKRIVLFVDVLAARRLLEPWIHVNIFSDLFTSLMPKVNEIIVLVVLVLELSMRIHEKERTINSYRLFSMIFLNSEWQGIRCCFFVFMYSTSCFAEKERLIMNAFWSLK